jgi:hypothetical protein
MSMAAGPPLTSVISTVAPGGRASRPTAARKRAILSAPWIGRRGVLNVLPPPPSAHSLASGASNSISAAKSPVIVACRNRSVAARRAAGSVWNRGLRAATCSRARCASVGLTVVAELVRAHDGRIQVTSTPGTGTAFTVCLPESA